SRPTVLKALAVISQVSAEGPTVPIPEALLMNGTIGAQTRLLYGLLQLTPEQGQFTYAGLAGLTGAGLNTVRRAVAELVRAGWLRTTQESQRAPVTFTLCDPLMARAEAEAQAADQRLAEAP
ncbi:MAG TPA: helix-turn-helix domain-containing protein, partial [Symbiobacteriaceae bacterium]|nr:helix-turn-helix domain-containing protein [Symbiobacteriaceae bacterium]